MPDSEDNVDVVKLLLRLRADGSPYPPELLTPSRQRYLRLLYELGIISSKETLDDYKPTTNFRDTDKSPD